MAETESTKDDDSMPFSGARFSAVEDTEGTLESAPAASQGKKEPGVLSGGPSSWLGLCGDCPVTTRALEAMQDAEASICRRFMKLALHLLDCTGRNIGQVCFANNPISGFLIAIGLAVAVPIVALSALVASTVGILFSLTMKQPSGNISAGLCCYNAALLGAVLPALLLGPGATTEPLVVWLAVIVGAICTVVISTSLANGLGSLKPAMPIFTIPFNLVALFSIVCLRVHQLPDKAATHASPHPPPELDWTLLLQGGVLGAGQVFAVEDLWCSGLVLLGMLICSPLLAIAGLVGSFIGTFLGAAVSNTLYEVAYAGILGYNAFLATCAVCFFYVPTWRSGLVLLVNAILTTAVQVALAWAFSDVSLPVLTLPFVGASLLVLGFTASEEALPRPAALTYPEQHRSQWQHGRRDSLESNASGDSTTSP